MQHFNHNLLLLLSAFAFSACTKEIDLDLGDVSNKVVIEAIVSEGPGPHSVVLTRSVGFAEANDLPGISNAVVTLSDDQGNSEQLVESGPAGTYTSSVVPGVQGHSYQLSVQVDGTTYSAQCTMPVAVSLDSLRIDSLPSFGTFAKVVIPTYFDPPGMDNYYRMLVSINGVKQPGIIVQSDRITDGNLVEAPLFLDDELLSGDVVQVTMLCISRDVYTYFFSMNQNVGNAATPADPVSNISTGALGYFTAQTSSTRSVVVP